MTFQQAIKRDLTFLTETTVTESAEAALLQMKINQSEDEQPTNYEEIFDGVEKQIATYPDGARQDAEARLKSARALPRNTPKERLAAYTAMMTLDYWLMDALAFRGVDDPPGYEVQKVEAEWAFAMLLSEEKLQAILGHSRPTHEDVARLEEWYIEHEGSEPFNEQEVGADGIIFPVYDSRDSDQISAYVLYGWSAS